jgi:aspartyl-tRNA(Asn)/glutamyl-tRNA(Gln) amidotransferase subunit C
VAIDRETIRELERLARIRFDEGEAEAIAVQLARILNYVRTIQSVDVDDVAPTESISHVTHERTREDEPAPGLDVGRVLGAAPDATAEFLRVPRVIERDEG